MKSTTSRYCTRHNSNQDNSTDCACSVCEYIEARGLSRLTGRDLHLPCSLVPRPHPQKEEEGLVTFERFLGSCKLSILTFAKANQIAAPRFSCDLASGRAATILQCLAGGLALANENAVL